MNAPQRKSVLLRATIFLCCASGMAIAADREQDSQSRIGDLPGSSRCLAECIVMEERCEELEKQFPACGTDDICLVEREQCDAKCRVTAMNCVPAPAGLRASG